MPSVEERLSQVETELAQLRSQVNGVLTNKQWIDQITGTFQDDPEFDEVLRLGREFRQSDRPETE
jgi:hypothetical protein